MDRISARQNKGHETRACLHRRAILTSSVHHAQVTKRRGPTTHRTGGALASFSFSASSNEPKKIGAAPPLLSAMLKRECPGVLEDYLEEC